MEMPSKVLIKFTRLMIEVNLTHLLGMIHLVLNLKTRRNMMLVMSRHLNRQHIHLPDFQLMNHPGLSEPIWRLARRMNSLVLTYLLRILPKRKRRKRRREMLHLTSILKTLMALITPLISSIRISMCTPPPTLFKKTILMPHKILLTCSSKVRSILIKVKTQKMVMP